VILTGEAFEGADFVLADSRVDVAGDADVEGAGEAPHDVGVAGFHVGMMLPWPVISGWSLAESKEFDKTRLSMLRACFFLEVSPEVLRENGAKIRGGQDSSGSFGCASRDASRFTQDDALLVGVFIGQVVCTPHLSAKRVRMGQPEFLGYGRGGKLWVGYPPCL
jgi:hypothetical protein